METSVYSASTVLNCFLLYLIKNYSTFGIKTYQILLYIDASLDLILGVIVLLSQPIALTCEGYFVMANNGFISGISPAMDGFLLTMFTFFLHSNILWVPVQFVYRYRLLCKDDINSRKSNLLIAGVSIGWSIWALIVLVAMCDVREEYQTIGRHILDLNGWPKRKDGKPALVVGSYITEWRMLTYLSLWVCTCTASIVIVIWCEKKISKHFKNLGSPMHSTTQRMHTEFHRALLAMAICPLITTTVPVYYFCTTFAFQLCPGWISALLTSATTSITLFNPLTTIICFRCYRQTALNLISCYRLKNLIGPKREHSTETNGLASVTLPALSLNPIRLTQIAPIPSNLPHDSEQNINEYETREPTSKNVQELRNTANTILREYRQTD
ncbi:serpentine type 7TM GPCR chemoreceptor srd domain-containing protein [Ditylenchus destructor]|nr:serpentine type 7TM GPCR chemoreceptor srd domain-containing protein [Ditylenchus destructor]